MTRTGLTALDSQLTQEFTETLNTALELVPVTVFLCGKAMKKTGSKGKSTIPRDLRAFLQFRLEKEFKSCRVRLGEHRHWMRLYSKAAGGVAFNLADHEIALASSGSDLIVIFPCSPGSFAELGMFAVESRIAGKMAIFLDARFKKSRSFVVDGPIAAAKRRKATVFMISYRQREKIWNKIRDLVLLIRANKGKERLLK